MGRGIYCASSLINATLGGSHHHTQTHSSGERLVHGVIKINTPTHKIITGFINNCLDTGLNSSGW